MKPFTIEINGTGTHNRGAELMAIAIAERMRKTFPNVRLVVSPKFGSLSDRRKYGFLDTWEFPGRRLGVVKTHLASVLWRFRKNTVNPAEVDVVLDASGFAFSDQWGAKRTDQVVRMMHRRPRRKQLFLLLPQALGPFKDPAVAERCSKLFKRAKLICARDNQSYESVSNLGTFATLKSYPDFTAGVPPLLPSEIQLPEKFSAIVPNFRMLDKTGSSQSYLNFIRKAVELMKSHELNPTFVLHDADEDRRVIEMLGDTYQSIPILTHKDPRVLKGILGKADFVIGSRFHALVSSLSQGVPCIGAGWSHKYPELFRDFSCPELLIPDLSDLDLLKKNIELLSNKETHNEISSNIQEAANHIKRKTNSMWEEVEEIIRKNFPSAG